MKFTTAKFSEFDTPAETARKLNAMLIQLQARLDVDAVRVGDTTKLDHNGDVTCADVTCDDIACDAVDAESVDTEAFTMATGASADEVLTSDAAGVGTWTAPAVQVAGSTTEVQFNDAGAFGAEAGFEYDKTTDTLTVDNIACPNGTETDEVINVDRTIDGNVTAGGVTVTETRAGTIGTDGHGGIEYNGTISGISGTCPVHAGFLSTIQMPDASAATTPACFQGLLDSNSSATPPTGPAVFRGQLALDNVSPSAFTDSAVFAGTATGSRSGEIFGLYSKAVNWGSGKSIGFKAYGISQGSTSALRGIGVWAIGGSTYGVGVGVFGEASAPGANSFGVVGKGHSLFYNGNVYVRNTTSDPAVTAVADKTHVTEAEDGSLWVENQMEVDGILYADGGAVVTGDLTVTGELKGARCCFDGAENSDVTASRYLDLNNGLQMNGSYHGYTMMHDGYILGISGATDVLSYTPLAEVHMEARINGSEVGSADHDIIATGTTRWYGVEPRGTGWHFSAGDLLSIYVNIVGTANIGRPAGVVEVQFDD